MRTARLIAVASLVLLIFALPGDAQAPTKLTATIADPDIRFGKSTTLEGRLTGFAAGDANQQIAVFAQPYPYEQELSLATVTTDARGRYSLRVRPQLNTRYRLEVVADPGVASRKSPIAWVYPKRSETVAEFVGPGRGSGKMIFEVWREHPYRFDDRPLFFYFRKQKSSTWTPAARTETREEAPGKITGSARFDIPRGNYTFLVFWCFDVNKGDIGVGRPVRKNRCPRKPFPVDRSSRPSDPLARAQGSFAVAG